MLDRAILQAVAQVLGPLFEVGFSEQNELVRIALNNRWLEEQGVPDMNAAAAIAARKTCEA